MPSRGRANPKLVKGRWVDRKWLNTNLIVLEAFLEENREMGGFKGCTNARGTLAWGWYGPECHCWQLEPNHVPNPLVRESSPKKLVTPHPPPGDGILGTHSQGA